MAARESLQVIGLVMASITAGVIMIGKNFDNPFGLKTPKGELRKISLAEVSEQTGRLQRAGIAVHFDRREPFMHHKFIVVDGVVAWMGSWNMTDNDTWRNNNNMLRFASRQIAADYTNEFEQMFEGRFGTGKSSATPYVHVRVGQTNVEVYFSPEDGVAKHVLQRLAAAKQSIHFMTFSYTSSAIADAMVAQAQAGMPVHGVFERQNAGGTGSAFGRLRQGGVDVLEDGNCYILHHKVIIVDARTVITGSYNFTNSAERDNDENLMIVDDPKLARAYLDEFDRVYAQAQAPTRCR
jgi:phosphatidylserine/phosphatidylglycerophosphate/cardiolipin synthase-like enzyme